MEIRRSCRNFLDKPVPKEKVDHIIRAVKNAPSGCNYQPLDVFVIQDREFLRNLDTKASNKINKSLRSGIDELMDETCVGWNKDHLMTFGSPCVFVVLQDKRRMEVTAKEDAGVMAATIMYAAQEVKLHSVIIGMIKFIDVDLLEALNLAQEDWEVLLAIPIGEPNDTYKNLEKNGALTVHYI